MDVRAYQNLKDETSLSLFLVTKKMQDSQRYQATVGLTIFPSRRALARTILKKLGDLAGKQGSPASLRLEQLILVLSQFRILLDCTSLLSKKLLLKNVVTSVG